MVTLSRWLSVSVKPWLFTHTAGLAKLGQVTPAAVGIVLFVIIFGATLVQRRLFGQAPSW